MSDMSARLLDLTGELQRRVTVLRSDEGPAWEARYRPGTFGCHELLDRTSLAVRVVEESILEHPSCVLDPEWYRLANAAVAALSELYERVAEKHLGAEHETGGGAVPDRRD